MYKYILFDLTRSWETNAGLPCSEQDEGKKEKLTYDVNMCHDDDIQSAYTYILCFTLYVTLNV